MLDYLVYSFGAPEYEILKFNPGDAEGAFHSESYPEEFPELLINIRNPNPLESGKIANLYRLSAVGSAQYSMRCQEFEEHENLSIFVDDFFPLPYGEKFSSCPQCGYNKPVIACVPGTFDTIDITGNRFVFMVYIVCRECLKISCTHIVD